MDITRWIESKKDLFTGLSDQVWQLAEIGYREHQSAALLANTLEAAGFVVERGAGEIPTAFVASYGTSQPVIAILGEYDALPGLSQDRKPKRAPLVEGGNGHGCGHNLLGAGSLAAAMAVKEAIAAGEVQGTVRYYGCPAEENGSAKAFMVKAGLFDDVDLSLTWHPGSFNACLSVNMLANQKVFFRFHGRSSHAAADPHNGRSALDAVELMNVGVNYLREHVIPEARMHYVITHGGGLAPNVVPAEAESLYLIRAPRPDQLEQIYERVVKVAQGAALMTETEVEIRFRSGASNLLFNDTITDVLYANMQAVQPPAFDAAEERFAADIAETFPPGSTDMFASLLGPELGEMLAALKDKVLFDGLAPKVKLEKALPGSTDVGDVSWATPTGQIMAACQAIGTPGHSWQAVAQGGISIGHKGMLYAAQVLGLTAVEFMQKPELLIQARAEFEGRIQDTPYVSPIPDGVRPPLEA
jgi:aminobenzoyl-glutamate utilization protein B